MDTRIRKEQALQNNLVNFNQVFLFPSLQILYWHT